MFLDLGIVYVFGKIKAGGNLEILHAVSCLQQKETYSWELRLWNGHTVAMLGVDLCLLASVGHLPPR